MAEGPGQGLDFPEVLCSTPAVQNSGKVQANVYYFERSRRRSREISEWVAGKATAYLIHGEAEFVEEDAEDSALLGIC